MGVISMAVWFADMEQEIEQDTELELDDDEITPEEDAFMSGYAGALGESSY